MASWTHIHAQEQDICREKNGGYDYVEVSINKDHTLNRDNVKYISHGQTKKLTRQETYQYFTDEYWTPFSMPSKYWDESWK